MKNIMALSLTIALVLGSDGKVDDARSEASFQAALAQYKAQRETEETEIAAAVNACFDAYPGAGQNLQALINGALNKLNVQPANYKVMSDKVSAYIHENSDRVEKRDRKTGAVIAVAEAPRTRLFGIKKGVGGGCRRWSDVPVTETEK